MRNTRNQHRLPGHRRAVTYGTAVALVVAGLTATTLIPTAIARPGTPSGADRVAWASAHVTLVTGDRVSVDRGGRVVGVARGKGRAGIGFLRQRVDGHTYVIPADAMKLLSSGRLDRRLFDITQLVVDRYDDAHRKALPLIVSYKGGSDRQAAGTKNALVAADAEVERQLPAVDGQALTVDKKDTAGVWQALTEPVARSEGALTTGPGVDRIWLDGKVEAAPPPATGPGAGTGTAQIGAPQAWKAGYDGKGVKVAVIDSGIDATHPDLKGRIIAAKDFTGAGTTDDNDGHGTHVASTIVGSGAASGGKYLGVAPGARLLNGKVFDRGDGSESSVIAGMQWAVQQGAEVVNMSLGQTDFPGVDPMEQAVGELSASKGVLFVIAAGNSGPRDTTLGSPGSAAAALTVAAVDSEDGLADFSSRGPTADDGLKPDISAPGVGIVAARAKHGVMGDPVGKDYVSLDGTSMATPHVAGAAAILAQEHPKWTGERIKAALMASAKSGAGLTAYEQGAGRVDLTRAIAQSVVAEPASLAFGTQAWPHQDDKPVTKTLTYRNTGSTPVTLDLQASGAPGVFSVSPAELTVPAGGTASATATADSRAGTKDGIYSGAVTATSADGKNVVRTPGLVNREVESYNLTVKAIGRNGKTPDYVMAAVTSKGTGKSWDPYVRDADGDYKATVRLPKGRYVMDHLISTSGQSGNTVMVAPNLSLTKDTTVVLDARKAKKAEVTAPDPRAQLVNPMVQFAAKGTDGTTGVYAMAYDGTSATFGQVGPSAPANGFIAQYGGVWAARGGDKPQYNIVVSRRGGFFDGLTRTVSQSSMARVDRAIGANVKDTSAEPIGQWETPGYPELTGIAPGTRGYFRSAPASRTVTYVSADQGLRWRFALKLRSGGSFQAYAVVSAVEAKRYEPGRTYRETWNMAVFGPLAVTGPSGIGMYRLGNRYIVCNSLLSEGHFVTDNFAQTKTVLTGGGKTYLNTSDEPCAAENDFSGLPKEPTKFKLTAESKRSLRTYRVSDRVSATWTFSSQYVDESGRAQQLPLSVVRFAPKLSLTATAKAGQRLRVPVVVQGPAAAKGHLKSLTVRVSYDGGRTWKPVTVHADASGKRYVNLTHPKRPGTVSFKAALADTEGNGYTGTIDNAYRTVR